MVYKRLVNGQKLGPARLLDLLATDICVDEPAPTLAPALDLRLVERFEVLPSLGINSKLSSLDHEPWLPLGDDGLGYLLDLVEGNVELFTLALKELRTELRAFLESDSSLGRDGSESSFYKQLGELGRVRLRCFPELQNRIGRIGHA